MMTVSEDSTIPSQSLRFSMAKPNSGFTLIEMLIVIAIIGILAAIALPTYQGYMIQARLSEVTRAITIVKSAVSAYRQEREDSWPNCPTIVEVNTSLGVGLGAVSRISSLSVEDGKITAMIQNIHPMVDGETLMLTPSLAFDSSISWTWEYSLDFPMNLRPKGNK